jgi:ubiquinone/menaquinone biosynthesis C-methylase UbiE
MDNDVMHEATGGESYVLGHSGRELKRLGRQAAIFADMTREVLQRAGVRPGMRVLDLGCGVGDVAFISADLVGSTGSVVGIDLSPVAVATATERAASSGLDSVSFQVADMTAFDRYADFDAVTGRFLLMHLPDPGAAIAEIARQVRPDTVIAFAEFDLATAATSRQMPLFAQCVGWIIAAYTRAGFEPNMGSKLYAAFRSAGLTPQLSGFTRAGAVDADGLEFLVESVKSLLPAMEKVGVATADDVDVATLGARLMAEATAADGCVFYPRFVGGWSRS